MWSGAMRDLEFICFSLIVIDGGKNTGIKKLKRGSWRET